MRGKRCSCHKHRADYSRLTALLSIEWWGWIVSQDWTCPHRVNVFFYCCYIFPLSVPQSLYSSFTLSSSFMLLYCPSFPAIQLPMFSSHAPVLPIRWYSDPNQSFFSPLNILEDTGSLWKEPDPKSPNVLLIAIDFAHWMSPDSGQSAKKSIACGFFFFFLKGLNLSLSYHSLILFFLTLLSLGPIPQLFPDCFTSLWSCCHFHPSLL